MTAGQEEEVRVLTNRRLTLIEESGRLGDQIRAIQQELIFERFHVREGCIVKGQGDVEYKVSYVELRGQCDTKPWIRGHRRKKDGTFGTPIRHLYDNWTAV